MLEDSFKAADREASRECFRFGSRNLLGTRWILLRIQVLAKQEPPTHVWRSSSLYASGPLETGLGEGLGKAWGDGHRLLRKQLGREMERDSKRLRGSERIGIKEGRLLWSSVIKHPASS